MNELASVGVPVHHKEYVEALLEGLPSDYASVVSVIESKKRTPSIAEIEALLYRHETRLMRYNKEAQVMNSASINYMQTPIKLVILVVLAVRMVMVVVVVVPFRTVVRAMVMDDLQIFNVKYVLNLGTQLMFAIFGLM